MICDRCFKPLSVGSHGVWLCPFEPRRLAPAVRADAIPGGRWIYHGLCNDDGTPRRYDSESEITRECEKRGLMRWSDMHSEDRTKEARLRDDHERSGEVARAMRLKAEARRDGARR